MDERRMNQSGRSWMHACCGMLTVLLLTLIGWAVVLAGTAKQPVSWLSVENAPLTARQTDPPEDVELYGLNGHYEVDFVLRNEGEKTFTLYNYTLDYTASGRSGYAWGQYSYPAPLLEPVPVLPAGQTIRFTQLVVVIGESSPEDAFPLTVRFSQYDAKFELGEVLLSRGITEFQ